MSDNAWFLETLAFTAATVLTVPVVVLTFLLALRWRFSRVLPYVGGFAVLVFLPVAIGVFGLPFFGVLIGVCTAAMCLVLWVFPLGLARWVLVQRGFDPERALRYATAGLPVAAFASFFLLYDGDGWYRFLYLTGVEVALLYSVIGLVLILGPTGVGFAVGHILWRIPVGAGGSR
jgi:hypothetical protein